MNVPVKASVPGEFRTREQLALPVASVLEEHDWPPTAKLRLAPETGTGGITEISNSDADRLLDLPVAPVLELRSRSQDVVCGPAVQTA